MTAGQARNDCGGLNVYFHQLYSKEVWGLTRTAFSSATLVGKLKLKGSVGAAGIQKGPHTPLSQLTNELCKSMYIELAILKEVKEFIGMNKQAFKFFEKHTNGIMRLLLICMGIPATVLFYIFPLYKYLLPRMAFLVLLVFIIFEIHNLLPFNLKPRKKMVSVFMGMLFPLEALVISLFPTIRPYQYRIGIGMIAIVILVYAIYFISTRNEEIIKNIIGKIGCVLFIAFYPGLLGAFFIMLPNLTNSIVHLVVVTGIVYSNDGMAYLLGRFFGKKNSKPIVKISPSKTIIGFIGGFFSGIIFFFIVYFIYPQPFSGGILKALLFAAIVSGAGMIGDLFESALKRSAHFKDSGNLMLGRGGVLDTFDSLLTASMVYYICYCILYLRTWI